MHPRGGVLGYTYVFRVGWNRANISTEEVYHAVSTLDVLAEQGVRT